MQKPQSERDPEAPRGEKDDDGQSGASKVQELCEPRPHTSSVTISEFDGLEEEEVDDVDDDRGSSRWEEQNSATDSDDRPNRKYSCWAPIPQPIRRGNPSSLRASSLEIISELTEMSFVENSSSDSANFRL